MKEPEKKTDTQEATETSSATLKDRLRRLEQRIEDADIAAGRAASLADMIQSQYESMSFDFPGPKGVQGRCEALDNVFQVLQEKIVQIYAMTGALEAETTDIIHSIMEAEERSQ